MADCKYLRINIILVWTYTLLDQCTNIYYTEIHMMELIDLETTEPILHQTYMHIARISMSTYNFLTHLFNIYIDYYIMSTRTEFGFVSQISFIFFFISNIFSLSAKKKRLLYNLYLIVCKHE